MMLYNSQHKQDEYLETQIFKGYKNGFYMDIGAHDGVTINNTLYFNKYNNWTGINIEPIKSVYNKLCINRPTDININCAVCNNNGYSNFIQNNDYTEMISGLLDYYDYRHVERLRLENYVMGSTSKIISVVTKKIETILDEYNIKHINYLTIDVEGAEFEVIKSINFNKVFIDVIGFENNYNDSSVPIIEYLKNLNYIQLNMSESADIFMIHKNSKFGKEV